MVYSGPTFYDDRTVFNTYMARRQQDTSANESIEKPLIWQLLGDVSGLDILDLGCGEATIAHELFAKGCRSYHGIDGSDNMITLAQKALEGTPGTAERDFMEFFEVEPHSYDLVLSRLAFHYIEDLDALLERICGTLRPGGRLVFSTEHPVITSSNLAGKDTAPRHDWIVDRYFQTGRREISWLGSDVIKYHRTIEDFFIALQRAGFRVDSLRESKPDLAHIPDKRLYERRSRVPLFLLFAATYEGSL